MLEAAAEDPRCAVLAQSSIWRQSVGLSRCSAAAEATDSIRAGSQGLLHTVDMEEAPNKRTDEAASLPENLLLAILRCVPILSLFHCKLVCHDWECLIKENFNARLDLQTVTSFFYNNDKLKKRQFISFTGVCPSFKFLPLDTRFVAVSDCCNGLILCYYYGPDHGECYIVCNPMTPNYKILPPPPHHYVGGEAQLCFDPTASPHFYVTQYGVVEAFTCAGVDIYSSKTDTWIYKESEWGEGRRVATFGTQSVFLNGFVHNVGFLWPKEKYAILVVDMGGNTWRQIDTPSGQGCLYQARGHLCLYNFDGPPNECKFSVWVLEDYGTNNWTLKHTVSVEELYGSMNIGLSDWFMAIAGHPEWNLIFFVGDDGIIFTYDMDHRKGHVTPTTRFRYSRRLVNQQFYYRPNYLPYVPLFSDSLAE